MNDKPTLNSFLDSSLPPLDVDQEVASEPEKIQVINLPDGEMDPRLKLLSHSSRTTLHKCPRKYQLYRLSAQTISLSSEKDDEQGVTFSYGKVVGEGIQGTLEELSEDAIWIRAFLAWEVDLLDTTPRQNKSFWLAMFGVKKFYETYEDGFLSDYELVYYQDKPAVELSFQITLPDGFKYRGFLDGVLRHKVSGEIMVLEDKTSSSKAQPAYFKNSGQALGYSVILDILFPKLSSYTVLYLVYETKTYEFVELPFKKSLLQRALWLQELLIDVQMTQLYHSYDVFPMHGENCYDFFRECEYLSLCTLSTDVLTKPLTQDILDKIAADEDETAYDFNVDFYDLVEAQVTKGEE